MGISLYKTTYAIYDYIEHYKKQYDGESPTAKEIAGYLRTSPKTVNKFLKRMEQMGMLEVSANPARRIRLIQREPNWNALVTPEPDEKPPIRLIITWPQDRKTTNKAARMRHSRRQNAR